MAPTKAAALSSHYHSLESAWTVSDRSTAYGRLVVPNGNSSEPFHRWFHLKEAYSSQLLDQLFADSSYKPHGHLRLYDPYSGSGTTLISAIDIASRYMVTPSVYGVERNPFLWELAQAKLMGRLKGSSLAADLATALSEVDRYWQRFSTKAVEIPAQSTLRNETYFPRAHVEALLALKHAIDTIATDAIRLLLRVCLAACVESAGRLRRDGRALRFMAKRQPRHPWEVFRERTQLVLADLKLQVCVEGDGAIIFDDGRHVPKLLNNTKFDWIVFSPPYPNNIDYTEIYKTEAWILGCYSNSEDMRRQRLSTVRSHPSLRFNRSNAFETAEYVDDVMAIIKPVVEAVPEDQYTAGRLEVITGYCDDMLETLKACRSLIHQNGRLAYIVGNSAHGIGDTGFVIAADVLMGALAEQVGWRVADLRVARKLTRRRTESPYLRESVVILEPC